MTKRDTENTAANATDSQSGYRFPVERVPPRSTTQSSVALRNMTKGNTGNAFDESIEGEATMRKTRKSFHALMSDAIDNLGR